MNWVILVFGFACLIVIFGTFLVCGAVLVAGIAEEIARIIDQHRSKPAEQRKALQTNIAGLEHQLGMDDPDE